MSAQGEIWRVSTVEGIFEADLDTLKQWIVEGCVLPTDKVSKGTLNWIEAGRAPMLRGAFNGEVGSTTIAVATTDGSTQLPSAQAVPSFAPAINLPADAVVDESETEWHEPENPVAANLSAVAAGVNTCRNHPDDPAKFICRVCATTFCQSCPRFIGSSSVPLCPLCGDLCRLIGQEREKFKRQEFRTTPFGFEDFTRALQYPWQNIIALLFGAFAYGFLQVAGFWGGLIGRALMFGCIATVINQVACGRLNRSFLPDFSEFSFLEDVINPLRLAFGITLVSWGPAILIFLIFIFGAIGGSHPPLFAAPPPPRPVSFAPEERGTPTDSASEPEAAGSEGSQSPSADQPVGMPGNPLGAPPPRREVDPAATQFIMRILGMGLILLPFFLLALAWGVFYYPMALTVAGYTETFTSVINPLVGIDTIKRMRGTYFKAFGMVILLQIMAAVIAIVIRIILFPFDMPIVGNLPATFLGGAVTFYFNLVIACVLGLSLHKCADRLGIAVD